MQRSLLLAKKMHCPIALFLVQSFLVLSNIKKRFFLTCIYIHESTYVCQKMSYIYISIQTYKHTYRYAQALVLLHHMDFLLVSQLLCGIQYIFSITLCTVNQSDYI